MRVQRLIYPRLTEEQPASVKSLGITTISQSKAHPAAVYLRYKPGKDILIGHGRTNFTIERYSGRPTPEPVYTLGLGHIEGIFEPLWQKVPVILGTDSPNAEDVMKWLGESYAKKAFAVTYMGSDTFRIEALTRGRIDVFQGLARKPVFTPAYVSEVVKQNAKKLRSIVVKGAWMSVAAPRGVLGRHGEGFLKLFQVHISTGAHIELAANGKMEKRARLALASIRSMLPSWGRKISLMDIYMRKRFQDEYKFLMGIDSNGRLVVVANPDASSGFEALPDSLKTITQLSVKAGNSMISADYS